MGHCAASTYGQPGLYDIVDDDPAPVGNGCRCSRAR
jgi:hypothetical protein